MTEAGTYLVSYFKPFFQDKFSIIEHLYYTVSDYKTQVG